MNRIRSLDGLRAISITMVLLAHAGNTMPDIIRNSFLFHFIANSGLGVRIFFVISGYLITKLLIIEKNKTGRINIKQFYLRRILRIFPIFYFYILVILILKIFFVPTIIDKFTDLLPASFYLWNYKHFFQNVVGNANWFLGHFWSLSMEEQFYLLWPFIFGSLYGKLSKTNFNKIILATIVLMPIIRIATYILMPGSRGQIGMMLHTGGDAILLGCLGALIENSSSFKEKFLEYINNGFTITLVAIFLFILSPMLSKSFKGGYDLSIGMSVNNICIMIIIFWCINFPSKITGILNSKLFIQIGVLSYSLYIWQQLFLTNRNPFWINRFPQNLITVIGVAFISYYFIEQPILKLKNRIKIIV